MPMRNPARWGLTLLLLALAPMTSCRVAQPPEVETAGVRIDVTYCKQKRGSIDCRLRIWNDHDDAMSFDCGSVRLMYGDDRECSLKPGRKDVPIVIGPRTKDDLRWIFESGESLKRGSYTVEIRDFKLDGLPSGCTAVFAIKL